MPNFRLNQPQSKEMGQSGRLAHQNIPDHIDDADPITTMKPASNGSETRTVSKSNNDANDTSETDKSLTHRPEIRWPDFLVQIWLHLGAVYGLSLLFSVHWTTLAWMLVILTSSIFGVTAGAHRLWSHKSYKAAWQLRLILMFLFTIAGQQIVRSFNRLMAMVFASLCLQRDAYTWALDHRVHHKYSETDADPHDARRGFFFAHIGWVFLTPHPAVVAKRQRIDMSDLEADGIVMWQKRCFLPLFGLVTIALPVLVPWLCWNESLWLSFWVNFNFRFCVTLNIAFLVNSVAHMYGDKPFDKHISPVDNVFIALAAFGEGWHNYHHVFPWDYKTGEFGDYALNLTSGFIDVFAKMGWVRDRKFVSKAMIERRVERCGDGSYYLSHDESHKNAIWGYGDADIAADDTAELLEMQQ